jgi:hypothetical protein
MPRHVLRFVVWGLFRMSKISFSGIVSSYSAFGQRAAAFFHANGPQSRQAILFVIGVTVLCLGLLEPVAAQMFPSTFNDDRVAEATNLMLKYIEGSFGALVMVVAGLGAILGAAFGQYRAALGLLVVAVGSFILRSVVGTFFNDSRIRP